METGALVVFITAGSDEEARKIAESVLNRRKAACVNIVKGVESLYWWEGAVENDRENLLIIKTKAELFDDLMDLVKSVHSYQVPEIIAMPVVQGNPDYLAWIGTETRPDEKRIEIAAADLAMSARLNESGTARQVWEALPLSSQVNVWGEEVYFKIPVIAGLEENAREVLELGEIAYWPEGRALCLFFGKTPASKGDDIRAISPVNVIGKVEGTPELFRKMMHKLEQGETLTIKAL